MLEVELTLDNGIEDLDVLRSQGTKSSRQLKILRITEEAYSETVNARGYRQTTASKLKN